MAIKKFKAYTNGRRNMSSLDYNKNLSGHQPEKSLLVKLSTHSGRNNQGKITTRHHGGRLKRFYRIIDFKRNKDDILGTIKTIEYDPNRSANISLVVYKDGEKREVSRTAIPSEILKYFEKAGEKASDEYEDKEYRKKNLFWGIVLVVLIVGIYFYFN